MSNMQINNQLEQIKNQLEQVILIIAEHAKLKIQVEELQNKNADLEKQLQEIQNDKACLEKEMLYIDQELQIIIEILNDMTI